MAVVSGLVSYFGTLPSIMNTDEQESAQLFKILRVLSLLSFSTTTIVAEFIYTMKKARKAHGDKVILDDVTLMFLPGAKIGVVGPNGAGKSTVLQIMAGLQQPSNGEAYLSPGYSVGILLQEPPLNEEKNVYFV